MHMCACMYVYHGYLVLTGLYKIYIYIRCIAHVSDIYIFILYTGWMGNVSMSLKEFCCRYLFFISLSTLPIPVIVITSTGASSTVFHKFLTGVI